MKKIKVTTTVLALAFYNMLFASPVHAVCPVCTFAVGAGLGLSRFLGIDDTVSGVWVGALLLSTSFWLSDWLGNKKVEFPHKKRIISAGMYAITFVPLWMAGVIGHPFNTIAGMDKLIFGTVIGSVAFLLGIWVDKKVRKIKGRQLFSYQKVVFPVSALVLTSLVLFIITSVTIGFR